MEKEKKYPCEDCRLRKKGGRQSEKFLSLVMAGSYQVFVPAGRRIKNQ